MPDKINSKLNRAQGDIIALNGAVAMNCARSDGVLIMVAASAVTATLTVEVSYDSTNGVDGTWFILAVSPSNSTNLYTPVATLVLTANPTIFWTARTFGMSWIRARASAFTSATGLVVTLSSHSAEM